MTSDYATYKGFERYSSSFKNGSNSFAVAFGFSVWHFIICLAKIDRTCYFYVCFCAIINIYYFRAVEGS